MVIVGGACIVLDVTLSSEVKYAICVVAEFDSLLTEEKSTEVDEPTVAVAFVSDIAMTSEVTTESVVSIPWGTEETVKEITFTAEGEFDKSVSPSEKVETS